ncbi:MAG: response regulator [Pseudanabaenales cyanobacterium]|nr:response regulator [Pseudanabaenales cyanobacterium]
MNSSNLERLMGASSTGDTSLVFKEFTAAKQSELFETLKQLRFSGQLVLTGLEGQKWVVYLSQGLIMYVTGGAHPVRQWIRNLKVHLPQIPAEISALQNELACITNEGPSVCWQYQLLRLWVENQKISREQAAKMIWNIFVEILFDITRTKRVSCELQLDKSLSARLVLIDSTHVITEANRLWRAWQAAKLANCSPDKAAVIRQSEQLQQNTSVPVYQMLIKLLGEQRSLRDLAVQMKRDVITVTRSLTPYIQSGLVELINIPDLPTPVFSPSATVNAQGPLIACVDDSPWVSQAMEKVITSANYRFVGLNDPLRAIGVLLALKPDLIFLDLMMPNISGYEICGQLRKFPLFRNTPIVILTGNDGVVDRVKAKVVGSTDFLSKEKVDAERVLGVVHKHLVHCTLDLYKQSSNANSPNRNPKSLKPSGYENNPLGVNLST